MKLNCNQPVARYSTESYRFKMSFDRTVWYRHHFLFQRVILARFYRMDSTVFKCYRCIKYLSFMVRTHQLTRNSKKARRYLRIRALIALVLRYI